jgi:hypothetical protein
MNKVRIKIKKVKNSDLIPADVAKIYERDVLVQLEENIREKETENKMLAQRIISKNPNVYINLENINFV